ncbi:hypothetical protein HAP48_0049185 (plasmid) [Bradyrhizobium septentrionale]|uniref:hypothetical protein n=1 Tax=Bradyrhizobium septentrionale TaxID=1404411 RepID=UPI001CCF0891|nr:hypothetical protein [Bradyrhizobium septentrionale]UGY20895.1 hypothetical protein HAP48_0049250 [Bradyrhizobium septentrionale]UGY20905.1 hypothetical protein HAP48_0049185 [Bradyrhizobium septentrionale]
MNKRNDALSHLVARPAPQPVPADNIVPLNAEPEQAQAAEAPSIEQPKVRAEAPKKPARKTVANSAARAMLYLPPKAKRKFKEIAFHEERKEHDVYVEALREYLEKRGHKGLL